MFESYQYFKILELSKKIVNLLIILNPIATEVIALFAVLGFWNTRQPWQQSNRPIVSALVEIALEI